MFNVFRFRKNLKTSVLKIHFYSTAPTVYDRMAPHSQTWHRTPTQDWKKKLGFNRFFLGF